MGCGAGDQSHAVGSDGAGDAVGPWAAVRVIKAMRSDLMALGFGPFTRWKQLTSVGQRILTASNPWFLTHMSHAILSQDYM